MLRVLRMTLQVMRFIAVSSYDHIISHHSYILLLDFLPLEIPQVGPFFMYYFRLTSLVQAPTITYSCQL